LDFKLKEIDSSVAHLEKQYQGLCTFYGEDPKSVASDEFFQKINRIWVDYKNVIGLWKYKAKS
jgi:hypothetical protein